MNPDGALAMLIVEVFPLMKVIANGGAGFFAHWVPRSPRHHIIDFGVCGHQADVLTRVSESGGEVE